MTKNENTRTFLDKAYDLDTSEKTRDFYRNWAQTYDMEVRTNGYASPARVAQAMKLHAKDIKAPLLDLGCGTGLSGEALSSAGFLIIDGSDFSDAMLGVAKEKHIYRRLILSDLDNPVPAAPEEYANFTAIGVFSPGHAPAEMIETVVERLPRGGCFGFTLNDHALEEQIYEQQVFDLTSKGKAETIFEAYGEHLPKAGIMSKVYILRKS